VCGRYRQSKDWSEIERNFGVRLSDRVRSHLQPRYNIAPTEEVVVISRRDGEREGRLMRWGLVPHWSDGPRSSAPMINARAETLLARPAFRSLAERRRCLIPADGFYEWETSTGGQRRPFDFRLASRELFAFAGLYTGWGKGATDEPVLSCTIITSRPNALVASLHDRMPVILPRQAHDNWLDPATSSDHALALLEPYPAALMRKTAVSPLVNSIRNDGPELLQPPEAPVPLFRAGD
jgi:putative SOS response-associated peptidase YedK